MRGGAWSVVVIVLMALVAWPAAASAQRVEPYEDRAGEFRNILPPGSNGVANAGEIAAFTASGGESGRPEHNNDQLAPYAELVFNSPGLRRNQIGEFFKDGSFGVPRGQVEERYRPCGAPGRPCDPRDDGPLGGHPCRDVTVVRDEGFGVPHIYGSTRAGTMCAAGYVAAEDRLFLVDVLRHAGRAELSSFAGGAEGNREMDRAQWAIAPYTEDDLQRQVDQFDELYGAEGARLQRDLEAYVAGLNQFAFEARANPLTEMPGEYYVLLGQENPTAGPQPFDETDVQPFQETDVVAIASLVGGIFGKGGGRELDSALFLESLQERFDGDVGEDVWEDFRSAEDPEAPTTVLGERFPYLPRPDEPASGSLALPDEGTAQETDVVAFSSDPGGGGSAAGLLDGLTESSGASSNALLVSGAESRSGHPLAVFGPQTGYFSPQLLMEMDIHGPGIDARGAAFAGTNLYVQLGRGDDYAWSATSAGQDNTDTFALDLCEPPGGGAATLESDHYSYRGECLPFEVLERRNAWTMEAPGQPPPGTETLRVNRTRLGLEVARATVDGTPVVYVQLRATYMHEVDSARGFADFNDPRAINGPRDYQRAANKISYTFNWFYTDDEDIAYFNSGENPERAPGIDPNFPVHACPDADCEFEWRDFRPIRGEGLPGRTGNRARYTPFSEHPQTINQSYLTSWNNKQARGFRASDSNFEYQTLYRSVPLDERILRETRGDRTMTLVELIDAMEDAGTVDLRGDQVLPWMLQALRPGGTQAAAGDDAAAEPSEGDASASVAGDLGLGAGGVGGGEEDTAGSGAAGAQPTTDDRGGEETDPPPGKAAADDEPADRGAATEGNATAAAPGRPDVRERSCAADLTRARAVDLLADWHASGANRRDMDDDGRYAHSCAIQVMDAWWPLLVEAMFVPTLGQDAYDSRLALGGIDNEPNNGGAHLGSAYQGGFYGYVQKDLRTLLGDRVRGRYSRTYCGGGESREGTLTRCRRVLRGTLTQALDVPREETYGGDAICEDEPELDPQYCFDTVASTPAGAITQPLFHWINRPTFQQVVEVREDRSGGGSEGPGGGGDGGPGGGSGPGSGGGGGGPTGAGPTGGGGDSGGGTAGDPTAGSTAPVGAAADAVVEAEGGDALPFTGLALGALALIGALLALGGALLRRRSRRA